MKDACATGECTSNICLEGCKFKCISCDKVYDDKRDVKRVNENLCTFLCNICYTQRNTYKIGVWYGEEANKHYQLYGHFND